MVRVGHLLSLLMLAAAASCSSGPDTEVLHAGGVSVLTLNEEFERGGAGVGIFGTLSLVGERCVGFVMREEEALLVFPPGTSVTGSGPELAIQVQGERLHLGDRFSGGSLFTEPKSLSVFGDLPEQVPSECQGLRAVAYEP
jgi:hypothetical protein